MKRALWVCCIGVLGASSVVSAQDAGADRLPSWGIMAGGVSVTGAYSGALSSGITGGVQALFPLESRHLSLRGDILYSWIDTYNACGSSGDFCGYVDTWSRLLSGSFSLVARLNDPVRRWSPYVFGGVAAYLTGNSDEPLTYLRPNHFGVQGGAGFEVRPDKHTYFVEVRYLGVPPGGFIPVVLGMRF
jgi:hypothetical protein